ncbi:hypothetical protein V7149_00310 [Bacillus sp. JJ1503]|uniref:hypothetical protein n=1 Tax=Bacillus sp. JJ1503 TaxID=3122956 RepID=UPI002FFEE711
MHAEAYRKFIRVLTQELTEIDRDLARESERQSELLARRAEVVDGLNGLKKELDKR